MRRSALLGFSVVALACGGATTVRVDDMPRSGGTGAPTWLRTLEHNAVVITSEFEGENYDAPPQSGSGLIIGISETNIAILTVAHLLVAPQNSLKSATLHFTTTTAHVEVPPNSKIERLHNDIVVLSAKVSDAVAEDLQRYVAPIKLAAPSEIETEHRTEEAWYTGRCGVQSVRSFGLQTVRRSGANESEFLVSGSKLPPGCSGGGVFIGGRLIGLMQRTDSATGHAAEVQSVLRQLRELHPRDNNTRNLLEPFGTLSFSRVPYQATYELNDGARPMPLTPKLIVPAGSSLLQVRSADSDEIARAKLLLEPEQTLDCRVQFATSLSRFRARSRYYFMGGSLLVLAAGGAFAGVAQLAYSDFTDSWSREARDRNQLFSSLSFYTLIAGAALLTSSAVFAYTGETHETSMVPCE